KNIESISSRQLSENRLKNSDVLISTVNLSENIKDYIKVSPILTDEDKKNIFEKTLNKAYKRLNKLNVVNKSSLFIQKLQKEEKNGKGIDYFLKEENILIDVVAKNWKESIEIVGNDLVNKKKIKKEYINDMIENIVNYGPYVVIQKGFALPHASISNNVLETSFVLARLKNPVKYNAFELDPIKYVCVLAVTEDKNHLKALFEFINLIRNKNFLKKLNLAKTSKDISELFKNKGEYI
ncbi:MAG: PTS sugar transporter subunit IIA, partial [Peptoniphilaceae bacterium]|nr:PTS sugar transporter subunit IIA [Peptoniphilaceae bacterium]